MRGDDNSSRSATHLAVDAFRSRFLNQLVTNLEILERLIEREPKDCDLLLRHIERVAVLLNERKLAQLVEELRLARRYELDAVSLKNSVRNLAEIARHRAGAFR